MFLTAKTAQALQHVSSALRLDPGHEPAQKLRKRVRDVDRLKDEGNTAFKAGQLEEANLKYTEALDVGPLRAYTVSPVLTSHSALEQTRRRPRVVTYALCCFPTVLQRY